MLAQRNLGSRDQNKMPNPSVSSNQLSEADKLSIMEALDHLYVTSQYQEMGCCSKCKKISTKKCSGCGIFYCSSECQAVDWPKHRDKCSKDSLGERDGLSSSRKMRAAPSLKNLSDDKGSPVITNRGSPFTVVLNNQLSKKAANVISENKKFLNSKIGNKQYRNNYLHSKDAINGLKDYKKISSPGNENKKTPKNPSSVKRSSPKSSVHSESSCASILQNGSPAGLKVAENPPTPIDGSVGKKISPRSRLAGKVKVIGTYRESPDRYWVMALSDVDKYEEVQSILNRDAKQFELVQANVGLVCACTYGDEWFRGKIVSITSEISVHFLDYGSTSNYGLKLFKKLPNSLRTMSPLAFLIEFEEGTPEEYKTADLDSEAFTIKETGKTPDGTPLVKVIDGPYGTSKGPEQTAEKGDAEKTDASARRSVMDSLTATTTGLLLFVPGKGTTRFASLVPDGNKEVNECLEKILNIEGPDSNSFEAAEGDYVLVTDKEGNHQRGKVVSKSESSYSVQLVDCGNVIPVDTVHALPENLEGLIELGAKVTVEKLISKDEAAPESCAFVVDGEPTSGKWPCTLKKPNRQIFAKVFLEKPEERPAQPETVHLKSGSTVEISSVISPNSFYIRSVDAETEQKFLDMNMEMMQFALEAKHFPIPPYPGELVCAKFEEDGCFYRATAGPAENGKVRVLFVDFGNEQETDLKDIKPLPESLEKVPFFGVKVTLKNVSSKAWNNKIIEYVSKLSSENVQLTLTYKGSLRNGVVLKEKVSGVVVNDYIEKARSRGNSFPAKKREIFLDDDLKYTTPPEGETCVLAILFIDEREFGACQTFWATVANVENFSHVNTELSYLISKHCESVSVPYRPVYREVCLAEYEGSWYRAICAGLDGDVYKVFFVDFGNVCELKAESIREMKEEFMSAPALAMNCILNGHERLKGNPALTEKIYEMLLNRINTCIRGVTMTHFKDDTFAIKIPEIEAILSS